MLEIGLFIGIFSYSILALGLLRLYYPWILIPFTILFWFSFVLWQKDKIISFYKNISLRNYSNILSLALLYLVIQAAVNSIGLFGPEIGFDATWYHLTLPKLYLMYHQFIHVPGGVLYYADMPKLAEMLYASGLSFGFDFFARIWQFIFGILTCVILYKFGRKYFSESWAILVPVIFYSSLVVGWESFSGYIDLARTFFTIIAAYSFVNWNESGEKKYFYYSAIFVGFSVATKLLSFPDLAAYTVLLLFLGKNSHNLAGRVKNITTFIVLALTPVLPYFLFSFIHTGSPVYPLFTNYPVPGYFEIFNPLFFITSVWQTFANASDLINPIFLAVLPFVIIYSKKLLKEIPIVFLLATSGFVAWYITPQSGGGRYILAYLPIFSIVSIYIIRNLSRNWQKIFIAFIVFVAAVSILYRTSANAKFLPLFFHKETMGVFMSKNLQYNLGDFYDIDGYFARKIKPTDKVLLFGFHNLYYVDFPFIDSSWVNKNDLFNFVAVQGNGLPDRFKNWDLVYYNNTTLVRLYSLKGAMWRY